MKYCSTEFHVDHGMIDFLMVTHYSDGVISEGGWRGVGRDVHVT